MPHDFPHYFVGHSQLQRWLKVGGFETMVHDLRVFLPWADERKAQPRAAILDSRTLHLAVDTLGHLLALYVTPANEQDRDQVEQLCAALQEATGESVELSFVDQGYTGERAAEAAHGIQLEVVKLPEAKCGFVLLPRRWVVERSLG